MGTLKESVENKVVCPRQPSAGSFFMRDPVIRKHYKKYRKRMGWAGAVFHICKQYGLDQRDVFKAVFRDKRDDG